MFEVVKQYKNEIKSVFLRKNPAFLAVTGPCSIFEEDETYEYGAKLVQLQKEVGSAIYIVMRTFVEKSRTSHDWRGFVYQPEIDKQENILEGIKRSKKLFSSINLPHAMEVINPEIFHHLKNHLSLGFIGARTSTSSFHRTFVSNTDIPFGFKNSLDGNLSAAVDGLFVARNKHCILRNNTQITSSGNGCTFAVLRGSENAPSYSEKHIEKTLKLQQKRNIDSPIMIDCSHGNCLHKPNDQKTVFENSVSQYLQSPNKILGSMLESNIFSGNSKKIKKYGVSYTDPCLSFQETRELYLKAADRINCHKNSSNYACSNH